MAVNVGAYGANELTHQPTPFSRPVPVPVLESISNHLASMMMSGDADALSTLCNLRLSSSDACYAAGPALFRRLAIDHAFAQLVLPDNECSTDRKHDASRRLRVLRCIRSTEHLVLDTLPSRAVTDLLIAGLAELGESRAPFFPNLRKVQFTSHAFVQLSGGEFMNPKRTLTAEDLPFMNLLVTVGKGRVQDVCVTFPLISEVNVALPPAKDGDDEGARQAKLRDYVRMVWQQDLCPLYPLFEVWDPKRFTLHNCKFRGEWPAFASDKRKTVRFFGPHHACSVRGHGPEPLCCDDDPESWHNLGEVWQDAADFLRSGSGLAPRSGPGGEWDGADFEVVNAGANMVLECDCVPAFSRAMARYRATACGEGVIKAPHWSDAVPCTVCAVGVAPGRNIQDVPDGSVYDREPGCVSQECCFHTLKVLLTFFRRTNTCG